MKISLLFILYSATFVNRVIFVYLSFFSILFLIKLSHSLYNHYHQSSLNLNRLQTITFPNYFFLITKNICVKIIHANKNRRHIGHVRSWRIIFGSLLPNPLILGLLVNSWLSLMDLPFKTISYGSIVHY